MEVELTLKQKLLHEINTRSKFFVAELVRISDYSSLGAFKKVLIDPKREFDKFQSLINVCEYIWGDKGIEYISQYSTEIDPNRQTARIMLEYLSTNRKLEALKSLLDRMSECSNKESREWSYVYSIQYFCQANYPNIDLDDIIRKVKSVKTSIVELKVFLKLIKTYAYNQKGEFYMPKILAEEIKLYFSEIENGYIKNMYQARMCETMSYVELRVFNNPEASREYSQQILESNIGKAFKAYANFYQGMSYLFTSCEKSLLYFTESNRIYKEMNRDWIVKDIDEKIELLKVYWDKLEDSNCYFETNYLLFNIKKGVNVSTALEEFKEKMDEPMYLYLKGYNEKNVTLLIESALKFVKKGDSYLASLPKNVLIEMGYPNIHLIEALQEIRVT
jgi:hypothetical protein